MIDFETMMDFFLTVICFVAAIAVILLLLVVIIAIVCFGIKIIKEIWEEFR